MSHGFRRILNTPRDSQAFSTSHRLPVTSNLYKKPRVGVSRVLSRNIIHLDPLLPKGSSALPACLDWPSSSTGLFELAPRRVYLISLRPNRTFFLLHLSSPRGGRGLPATLPCGARTFLPPLRAGDAFPLSVKILMAHRDTLVNNSSF